MLPEMPKPVKINFFQKSLDTRFRNFLFSYNQGDYFKYLANRLKWYLYPNIKRVSKFPLHLDIEVSAFCNLKCPMCANRHVDKEKQKNYGHMDFDLFRKIVDECAQNKIFSIRLSWRGEVLTNPDFFEYVRYAKVVKKIPQVSFLTNGTGLDEKTSLKLIEMGVDYISVSVDGLDGMYEKIRYPSKFENVYSNLARLMELRENFRKKKPQLRVTTLWPAIAQNPDEFYRKMERVSDKIVYNPLKDYSVTVQDRPGFDVCQFLWERLFVGFDGLVHPCSNTKDEFVIDDAKKNSITDIWHGNEMSILREKHNKGKRLDVFPCNKCSYGVDFEKRWKDRDWSQWNPAELIGRYDEKNG